MSEYKLNIGDSAPDFSLPGIDGKTHSLSDYKSDLLVVFFSCNHCPYAQNYENRVKHLVEKFKGCVDFVAINSNDEVNYPEDSYDNMVTRAKNMNYNFDYLRDESQDVAKEYGGECTPHFFLFDKDRKLRYQGRMDDNWQVEDNVQKKELLDAIRSLLDGKEVEVKVTDAIGCSIKWK